jgi:hypothetical protein
MTKEETGENQAVKRAVDEVMAENEVLRAKLAVQEERAKAAETLLAQANDYIANQKRSELILEVQKEYDVGVEFISTKSTDELKKMVELAKLKKVSVFKSSADTGNKDDIYYKLDHMYKFDKK